MGLPSYVIINSYRRFLAEEHARGVRKGCLGKKCFVSGCEVEDPLYPVGDDRFWCGMCEKHAGMRKSYKMYVTDKLEELQGMLSFDEMMLEEDD